LEIARVVVLIWSDNWARFCDALFFVATFLRGPDNDMLLQSAIASGSWFIVTRNI